MTKPFKWTDERVLEFHKMTTTEVYGALKGAKTLKEKLKKYKEIKRAEDEQRKQNIHKIMLDNGITPLI